MLRLSRFSRPVKGLAVALLALGVLAYASGSAMAQEGPAGFLERGIKGLFGGSAGGSPGRPGEAYAAPSGIPDAADLNGLSAPRALNKLDPIALPKEMDALKQPLSMQALPSLPAYAPQSLPGLDIIRQPKTLTFQARLSKDTDILQSGLVWRLFSPQLGQDGKLPLLAQARGGIANFEVPPGDYLLHVGFGRAGMTKRVRFDGQPTRETLVLDAGGLKLNAICAGDIPISGDLLTFDIYSGEAEERDRRLIAGDIAPKTIVQLGAGTYHVVSNFGSINASVGADVRVEAGKITEATLQHHAAVLTMKLVREKGGEAIADTAWSIANSSGDVVQESVGAFPSMVLSEGDYVIVARNKDRVYQRDFQVKTGQNTDVEVLTSNLAAAPEVPDGSGD